MLGYVTEGTMDRRRGHFRIDDKWLIDCPELIARVFSDLYVIPLHVEHRLDLRQLHCNVLSPLFREVQDGQHSPDYMLLLEEYDHDTRDCEAVTFIDWDYWKNDLLMPRTNDRTYLA